MGNGVMAPRANIFQIFKLVVFSVAVLVVDMQVVRISTDRALFFDACRFHYPLICHSRERVSPVDISRRKRISFAKHGVVFPGYIRMVFRNPRFDFWPFGGVVMKIFISHPARGTTKLPLPTLNITWVCLKLFSALLADTLDHLSIAPSVAWVQANLDHPLTSPCSGYPCAGPHKPLPGCCRSRPRWSGRSER